MSKVSYISKSFYNISVSKCLSTLKSINGSVSSKNVLYQNNKLFGTPMTFIPFRSFSNYLRNSSVNSTYEIPVRHFTQSNQSLCNIKENLENQSTENEQIENSSEDKGQPIETEVEKELKEKIKSLIKEVDDYKDKYQRSLADRENLRNRLEKQIQDSKQFGIQSFCKDLLEVTDVFEKAIENVPEETVKEADPVFISLYDGIVMTESHLISVFRRHGLKKIIPKEGEKFDPSVQEAMFEVPVSEGKTPGTVANVIRTGWKLHDRCIRSAQVGVIKT